MREKHEQRLWTFPFIAITLAFFFSSTSQQMINSSFSLFIDHLHGSATFSGMTAGAFAVSAIIARAFSGRVADRISRRTVVLFGGIIYALSVLGFVLLQSFGALLVLRITQGFGYAALNTAECTMASDVVPEKRTGEGLGYFGLGLAFANAFGPQIVMLILNRGNFETLYLIIVVVILLSFVCGLLCRYKEPKQTVPAASESFLRDVFEKKSLPAGLVAFFSYAGISMVFTFLTLYATKKGFSNYGMFFTVSAVSLLISKLFTGKIADRFGTLATLLPTCIIGIVLFVSLAITNSYYVFLAAGALYGLFLGAMVPILNAEAIRGVPAHRRGAAVATFYIFIDLGIGVGGMLWGWTVDQWGFTISMYSAAVSVAIALGLGLAFFRNNRLERSNEQ